MHARLAVAALLAATITATAFADPRRTPFTTYDYEGRSGDRDWKGTLGFVEKGRGRYEVHAIEKAEGQPSVEWTGEGTLFNNLIKVKRARVKGIDEALTGAESSDDYLEYDLLFEAGFAKGKIVIHQVSDGRGRPRREERGTATVSQKPDLWEAGELVVFTKAKIDELAHRGVEKGHELDFLRDYAHVGVRAGVRLLADSERTGWMRAADEKFRASQGADPKEPVWIEVTAAGTTAVGKELEHALDGSGTLTFTPGFRFEKGVKYKVVQQNPGSLSSVPEILAKPVLTFHLPLDAAKAAALPTGEQRTYEGWSSVNLSGTLEYGPSFKSLFKDKEEIKFDGTASVTWQRTGTHRLFVEKQFGQWVHVEWTRSTERDLGLAASAVFGLLRNQDAIDELKQPLRAALTAGLEKTEGFVTIQFSAGVDWVKEQSFDVDMVLDLGDEQGRVAYEAAIRGDLAAVEKLARAAEHPGIKRWRRTDTASKALEKSVSFDAFNLLKYSHSSETRTTAIEVQSLNGSSTTTAASVTKSDDSLFGHHHKELSSAATHKEVRPNDGPKESALRFEFTFERDDPKSSPGDVADRFALARTLFADVEQPAAAAGKIPTHTRLEIDLGTAGLAKLLALDDATFLASYGRACWGKGYVWTPERVARLAALDPTDSRNDAVHDEILRAGEARSALKMLAKARSLAAKPAEQVKKLRDIAKSEGYKLHAAIAFALATGREDTKVSLTIASGEETLFQRAEGEARDLPEDP